MSPVNPLNPAAGDVPAPEDPREIAAALRAGRISLRLFPYVAWRYGERGEKFTQSDSGWLAWLTRHSQERADGQIRWLHRVLANRGMPGWILECHLEVLCRQLTRTIPENQPQYRCLADSAARLRLAREQQIPSGRARGLAADFAGSVGGEASWLLQGTAHLLVSAVADERLGARNAVRSLERWLVDVPQLRGLAALRRRLARRDCELLDAASFEARWTSAVETIIASARRGQAWRPGGG